jgi:hypothetical protein
MPRLRRDNTPLHTYCAPLREELDSLCARAAPLVEQIRSLCKKVNVYGVKQVVEARQADGHSTVAVYLDYRRAAVEDPIAYIKNGTKMEVKDRHTAGNGTRWILVNQGWLKRRNVVEVLSVHAAAAKIRGEGHELLRSLRLYRSEMRSLPLRRGSPLLETRDEAVKIASVEIDSAEALAAALGLEQQKAEAAAATMLKGEVQLPPDWTTAVDPDSGDKYYFNTRTNETSWDPPPVEPPPIGRSSMRDSTGTTYNVGDSVQYSSDTHGVWVPAEITHIDTRGTLDLAVLRNGDVPHELRVRGAFPRRHLCAACPG